MVPPLKIDKLPKPEKFIAPSIFSEFQDNDDDDDFDDIDEDFNKKITGATEQNLSNTNYQLEDCAQYKFNSFFSYKITSCDNMGR